MIEVPEDFRMVTDAESLSIQLTPIGDLALVSVTRIDLETVELKSSRDVAFFFTVNGVRKAFKDRRPVVAEPYYFVPGSPSDRLEAVYNEEIRRRLVENGTFNPDGSVNMETAERLGRARAWREAAASSAR